MRKPIIVSVVVAIAALAAAPNAHAGVGVGMFLGEPLGLTFKADLKRKTALEFLIGVDDYDDDRGRDGYGHLTFLVAPWVGEGESVMVPIRLGIGVAIYDDDRNGDWGDSIDVAARAPLQLAFQFRKSPLEIYLEIAVRLEIIDDFDVQPDGGIGFRIYF